MSRVVRSLSPRARLVYGSLCIALGCYPLLISVGIIPVDASELVSPLWVLALTGFVFLIGGVMILLASHSWVNDLLASLMLLLFGLLGAWVSLFGPDVGFSGGLPFLTPEQNTIFGRWLFGLGATISFATCAYALRRAARLKRTGD